MKKSRSLKTKDTNLKSGKLVDNSRLVDKKGFARGKNETDPAIKFVTKEYKSKQPETIRQFVDMLDQKKNEDIGLY